MQPSSHAAMIAKPDHKREVAGRTIGETKPHADLDPLDVARGPQRFGRYVALEKLGHGGMGVVYAAYDESLDRKVALKLLRAKASENTQQRLRREAQAMARLSHPNVVQIYESSEHEGQTCVVMEYVDGVTLREWMAERRRSRREILEVFIAAGRGLAAAHQKGLIHRDFKPDNVMIARSGRVQVMDFGLARGDDEAPETRPHPIDPTHVNALSTDLTADGAVIGTPAYMAPEQIEGRKTDPRSDQFSFCVTLWEALFERRPFAASSLSEMSDVVSAGKFDQVERSKVPGWLRRVLRRGLLADPELRWPSMDELLDALERDPTRRRWWLIGGLAGTAALAARVALYLTRVEPTLPTTQDAVAADRSTCDIAGREIEGTWNDEVHTRIAAAFAATQASYADSTWMRASAWLDDYAAAWSQLRAETCLATLSSEADAARQAEISACLDHHRVNLGALLDAWANADTQTVTLALSALSALPPVSRCTHEGWLSDRVHPSLAQAQDVARLRAQLDRAAALRLAGKFAAARDLASAARSRAQSLAWRPLEAEVELAVGRLDDDLGDYEAAQASLQRAYLAAIAGGHDYVALEAVTWLSLVVGDKLTRFDEGLSWARLGLMFVERLRLQDSFHEAELLYALGLIQDHMGNYADAQRSLERALALTIAERGEAHPEVAHQLNGLGGVFWATGEFQQALDTQVRALKIVEDALGPEHPEVGRALNNMGMVLGKLGKLDEALDAQERALKIREAALGPEHPEVAATLNAIGASFVLRGDFTEALDAHRRALRILEATLGPKHVSVALTLDKLALAELGRDNPMAALSSARRALGIIESTLGPSHHDVATILMTIGQAHARLGERSPTREAYTRALAIREAELGDSHPLTAQARQALASL